MTVELTDEEYERLQMRDEVASEFEDELYETARQYQHLAEVLFRIEMEIESLAIDDEFLAEIREEVRHGQGLYEKVGDESR